MVGTVDLLGRGPHSIGRGRKELNGVRVRRHGFTNSLRTRRLSEFANLSARCRLAPKSDSAYDGRVSILVSKLRGSTSSPWLPLLGPRNHAFQHGCPGHPPVSAGPDTGGGTSGMLIAGGFPPGSRVSGVWRPTCRDDSTLELPFPTKAFYWRRGRCKAEKSVSAGFDTYGTLLQDRGWRELASTSSISCPIVP